MPAAFRYQFDPRKAAANVRKHGVSFEEAISVFEGDPAAYTDFDPDHSNSENRFFTIGTSADGKLLFISHNEVDGQIRIISARRAQRRERKLYEDPDSL
jgi:uncharacterized DUF497 family protein